MIHRRSFVRSWLAAMIGVAMLSGAVPSFADAAVSATADFVQFNRDVRPILSEHCYACHGPDANQRQAGLRLDQQSGLYEAKAGRRRPVVPGRLATSEIMVRITSRNADVRMPPPAAGKALSAAQIDTLRRWIQQGAPWQGHWSYTPLTRPAPPDVATDAGIENDIDRFVRANLSAAGLRPADAADRVTLIRRLSLDLVGLPPTVAEVDAFVADRESDAYERLVERLLASPHYGERMAMFWLDLVRFADTIGYHSDNPRNIAAYRDYVINAFNDNLPFDRFTIEQLAGDLLPAATRDQKVASGYNRLNQTTEEGGAQPKEYEAKSAADRVRNLGSVWLGATVGCAECHDHKFDPYTSRDFYSLAAFFADVKEDAVGHREPGLLLPTAEQAPELARFDAAIAPLAGLKDATHPTLKAMLAKLEAGVKAHPEQKSKVRANIVAALAVSPAQRTQLQREVLAGFLSAQDPKLVELRKELADLELRRTQFVGDIRRTLVTVSAAPRTVRMLPRGNWLDASGDLVEPSVPRFLATWKAPARRANRLDLARWIVARDNPLPARVLVNRLWKLYFGQGLASLEDLGSQGAWPTHPKLLDWLAVELLDHGWDVKHMVRLMVLSGTYRQSSRAEAASTSRDPGNMHLSRQTRFRLDAELVRDNALAISGLLVAKIGGDSVMPYQPAGYWDYLNFPTRTYEHDKGQNQYRRGLYTHWQRSFLHPSLLAFDAPSREECVTERPRSNTPQQALVLLNDPTYVEAARVFAEQILKHGGREPAERITWAWRRAVSRSPTAEEIAVLRQLLNKHRGQFASDAGAAERTIEVGESPPPADLDAGELAAWTSVARTLLNLHETVTRN